MHIFFFICCDVSINNLWSPSDGIEDFLINAKIQINVFFLFCFVLFFNLTLTGVRLKKFILKNKILSVHCKKTKKKKKKEKQNKTEQKNKTKNL